MPEPRKIVMPVPPRALQISVAGWRVGPPTEGLFDLAKSQVLSAWSEIEPPESIFWPSLISFLASGRSRRLRLFVFKHDRH